MRPIRFVPSNTKIDFVGMRKIAFLASLLMIAITVVSVLGLGLNFGIDFRGGVMVEVKARDAVNIGELRGRLSELGLGEVALQEFGGADNLLIRVQRQPGGDEAQMQAVDTVKQALGPSFDYRRVEVIGPKVSEELLRDGILAALLAVVGIGVYVWFRFEWQFGVAALIATFHDVITAVGLYALTGLEFNLTSVAALLTIAGYSINDTVVVFDRIRENMRKYKTMPFRELINLSINETLSRTVITSGTTMLAVLALIFAAGPVIFNFSLLMAWGLIVGTFSTVYVAAAILLYMKPLRPSAGSEEAEGKTAPEVA